MGFTREDIKQYRKDKLIRLKGQMERFHASIRLFFEEAYDTDMVEDLYEIFENSSKIGVSGMESDLEVTFKF